MIILAHVSFQCPECCSEDAVGKLVVIRIHSAQHNIAGPKLLENSTRNQSIAMSVEARHNLVVRGVE